MITVLALAILDPKAKVTPAMKKTALCTIDFSVDGKKRLVYPPVLTLNRKGVNKARKEIHACVDKLFDKYQETL